MRTVKITTVQDREPERFGIDEAVRRVAGLAAEFEPRADYWRGRFRSLLLDCAALPSMSVVLEGRDPAEALANHFGLCAGACRTGMDTAGYPGAQVLAPRLARLLVEGKSVNLDLSAARPCAGSTETDTCDLSDLPKTLGDSLQRYGVRFAPRSLSLRVDHPDLRGFFGIFGDPAVPGPRLVVKIPDAFMVAVRDNREVSLVHSISPANKDGSPEAEDGAHVYSTVRARALWDELNNLTLRGRRVRPVFTGLNRPSSPLAYTESADSVCPHLLATVPAESALTTMNLRLDRLVTPPGTLDIRKLKWAVETAVRLADNLIDCVRWPLDGVRLDAIAHRRVALNLTGIGDTVVGMGLDPGRFQVLARLYGLMQFVRDCAYRTSVSLARERHPFPGLRTADLYALMPRPELREHVDENIHAHATRNSHLIALSPYAMLPGQGDEKTPGRFSDLLPLLRFADNIGFHGRPDYVTNVKEHAEFLRLTWAYGRTISGFSNR